MKNASISGKTSKQGREWAGGERLARKSGSGNHVRASLKRSRKSQLYLLTAIFLSVLAFLVAERPMRTAPGSGEPLLLYENFVSEAPRVINSALYNDRNMTEDFADFTENFVYHASTKNINLSLFYVLIRGDNMVLSNKMNGKVNVTSPSGEAVLNRGESMSLPASSSVSIEHKGISYPFSIDTDRTGFKLIFRTDDSLNNTEVYTYG